MALIQFWPQSQKVAAACRQKRLQAPSCYTNMNMEYSWLLWVAVLDRFGHYDHRVLAVVMQDGITWCDCVFFLGHPT